MVLFYLFLQNTTYSFNFLAQEREKERRAAETEESDLSAPQIQKECKILKKGERPVSVHVDNNLKSLFISQAGIEYTTYVFCR